MVFSVLGWFDRGSSPDCDRGVALKRAAVMMRLGSGILSCWAVYLVIGLFQEMAHRSLNTSLLSIMIAIVFIVLLSNFAAYKIYGLAAKTS
jgi:hypothetical protein